MSPIDPRRLRAPFLGGRHAHAFAAAAMTLCRSMVVKGRESLLLESMLAARHHGVERDVLDSPSTLLPGTDWEQTARYMVGRTLVHGRRRAEEMTEAAATVVEAGVAAHKASATARSQASAATLASRIPGNAVRAASPAPADPTVVDPSLTDLLDALLSGLPGADLATDAITAPAPT